MIEAMSSRERVFAAFDHKKVDRVPVWDTDSNVWAVDSANMSFADMLSLPDVGVDIIINAFDKLDIDIVSVGAGAWLGWYNAFGCPISVGKTGVAIEVSACIKDADTDIPHLDKSKIKEQIANSELCQKILKQTRIFKEKIGDKKIIQFTTGGPFTMANILVGTEDLMVLLAEENQNITHLLEFCSAAVAEMCNQVLAAGCDVIFTAEPNASCDMISPTMYNEIVVPSLKDYLSQLNDCKYNCMHICGESTTRIPSVVEMGFSGMSVDSVVDIKAAMATYGNKISMMGNISPVDVMLLGTPEQVYDISLDLALNAGLESGFFLSPGCDLPPKTPIANALAMAGAARDAAKQISG